MRLNEDINDPNSVYQKVNKVFDMLPLAALVEEKILCLHAGNLVEVKFEGIGKKLVSVE
jgi:hypothetical protein